MRKFIANTLTVLSCSMVAAGLALVLPQPGFAATTPSVSSALVLQDQLPLRAAAKDGAPLLTPLWRGEALELRGRKGDWLQVWDHRRERGGFVRADRVLAVPEGEAVLPELMAQLRLVRQQPGAESLGLGLAAAAIERADVDWLGAETGAELLDAMVELQQRLAARVNAAGPNQQPSTAAHAEVATRYGHPLRVLAQADGGQRVCANEEPARWLRAHPKASATQQARAALALTESGCVPSDLPASQLLAVFEAQTAWLEGIALNELSPTLRNRLLLRRAGAWSSLAYAQRHGSAAEVQSSALIALQAWGQLIPAELGEDDAAALREAAIRLAPMRFAAQTPRLPVRMGSFELRAEAGGPGERCLLVVDLRKPEHPVVRDTRCSHGLIHWASARLSPDGKSIALAVQPLDGWTELWRVGIGGEVQVLPPMAAAPGLGIAEFAGFVGPQMLVAREAVAEGKAVRRFEIYGPDFKQPQHWAHEPSSLGLFQRRADAAWKAGSPIAR